MKKTFAVLMVLVMMLALSVTAFAAGNKLTQDQAKQAALEFAGVQASDATFTKVKRDWDDGREVFEIKFYANDTEYEMDVDVLSGRITDFSAEYNGSYAYDQTGGSVGYGRDYDDDWDDRYEYSYSVGVVGGWTAAENPEITPEIEKMLTAALESYQTATATVSYKPVLYLGSQVVAGTNHAILCKAEGANRASTWVIVYLYEDLKGNVTVMNIANFDFGLLCNYGAGSQIG